MMGIYQVIAFPGDDFAWHLKNHRIKTPMTRDYVILKTRPVACQRQPGCNTHPMGQNKFFHRKFDFPGNRA